MDYNLSIIPEGYQYADFSEDPEKVTVIYGDDLENGMVAVIADPLSNHPPYNPEDEMSPYEIRRQKIDSRWTMVTSLVKERDLIKFIGVYSDGTKMVRQYHETYAWYVLKETM